MPLKALAQKKQILFLSYEGQKYEIPAHKKIVFIDLPPNKYFEVEAINLDDRYQYTQNVVIHFECLVFPLSPAF